MSRHIRGFAVWVFFMIASGSLDWRYSALIALAFSLIMLWTGRHTKLEWEALQIDISSVVFFGLLTAYAFAAPDSSLQNHQGGLSWAWLALTAWTGIIAGRPFTLALAKPSIPREGWTSPAFIRGSYIVTGVWAVSFTVTAVIEALMDNGKGVTTVGIIVNVAGFTVPAYFTAWFRKQAMARRAQALEAEAALATEGSPA